MPEQKQAAGPDISLRAVGWGAVAIAGGIAFALAVAWGAWRLLHPEPAPPPGAFRAETPLLLSAPQPEKADYFAAKERLVGSYGWVDRRAGVARIPVEEAMRLLAGRQKAASPAQGRAPQ